MHVGVFDSGVGGFSVLKSLQELLPALTYSYCCDQANFPYGTKRESDVVDFTTDACRRFVGEAQLDILVIACGTASTLTLPAVRSVVNCPVVGVVPAVKPAAASSQSKSIAILATHATVAGPYLKSLIDEYAADCKVVCLGSSELVRLAELKIRGHKISIDEVAREIKPLFAGDPGVLDTVVLGCTHFPLLVEEFNAASAWPVRWLDSGAAIARRVESLSRGVSAVGEAFSQGYTTGELADLWSANGVPDFVRSLGLGHWKKLSKR